MKTGFSASVPVWLGTALMLTANLSAPAQSAPAQAPRSEIVETISLNHISQTSELNEASSDLRNMIPRVAVYAIPSLNAISVRGTDDEIQSAKKLLADLDRPRTSAEPASALKDYRLTYTMTEMQGDKPGASQHFSMTVAENGHGTIKHGDRVPIATGAMETAHPSPVNQVQFQYIDVGVSISASLDGSILRTKFERSTVSDQKSTVGIQDPIIQQVSLENMSRFEPSKPLVVGTVDLPNSTRSVQIEVIAEPIS